MMKRYLLILPLALGLVFMAGCSGKEFAYSEHQELKEGPGLLSGEDGVFTLYQDKVNGSDDSLDGQEQHEPSP